MLFRYTTLHRNLRVAMKVTVTKGIEPTRFSSTCCIIVRKCSVYTPNMAFIVNSKLVLINWCPTFLPHPWTKARWAVWAALLYTVCMKSSGPKWALSLMIIIHVVIIQETFYLFSSSVYPHCILAHSCYNLWITDLTVRYIEIFQFCYFLNHIFERFGLKNNMPFSYVFHDEHCNTVQVAVITDFSNIAYYKVGMVFYCQLLFGMRLVSVRTYVA